jgi:hypothetical protein
MKHIRQFCTASILILAISFSAFAGVLVGEKAPSSTQQSISSTGVLVGDRTAAGDGVIHPGVTEAESDSGILFTLTTAVDGWIGTGFAGIIYGD